MHFLSAFVCAYMAVGGDVVALGADRPFETGKNTLERLEIPPICEADKE
ncbi:MAG: hypothetical protein ABII06_20950 [Pseudomonadota bacterium]